MEVLNLLNTDPELFERPCLWTRRQELGKSSWQRKPCQSLGWLQRKHSCLDGTLVTTDSLHQRKRNR